MARMRAGSKSSAPGGGFFCLGEVREDVVGLAAVTVVEEEEGEDEEEEDDGVEFITDAFFLLTSFAVMVSMTD